MKRFKYIILAVCFGALPLSSSAQKKAMTLQECIDMALNNNLYMKAGTVSVGKARDLQGTAFDMEKTSVTLSQDPTSGGGDNGITVSQSFEFPTRLRRTAQIPESGNGGGAELSGGDTQRGDKGRKRILLHPAP